LSTSTTFPERRSEMADVTVIAIDEMDAIYGGASLKRG